MAGASVPAALRKAAAAGGLALRRAGPRLDVVLDRPGTRNAQTPRTWRALAEVGAWVASTPGVGVVVLSGTGPSFSSGLDRALLGAGTPDEPGLAAMAGWPGERVEEAIAGFQRAFSWWRDVDAVSVAAVAGHAVGAGLQLALACDLRVLADDARLAVREPALGLVPDLGGTGALVDLVGYPRALEICATGREVGADEAVRIGLAERSVPRADLDAAVEDVAAAVLGAPAGAVAATKRLLAGAAGRDRDARSAAERHEQVARLRAAAVAREAPSRARR